MADTTELAPELVEELERMANKALEEAKASYDNTLVPFSEFASKAKEALFTEYNNLFTRLHHVFNLIEERFLKEEQEDSAIPDDAKYDAFRPLLNALNSSDDPEKFNAETLQEAHKISPEFMDRIYRHAMQLMNEGDYEESKNLFYFLRYLNPVYYEYWVGEATCLQEQQKYEEAVDDYVEALFRKPSEPLPLFQLANCYLALGNRESASSSVEACLDRINELEDKNETIQNLESEAINIRNALVA